MNFLNKLATAAQPKPEASKSDDTKPTDSHPNLGGLLGQLSGGTIRQSGAEGEKQEDLLDKAVDFVQAKMGKGDQSNESVEEQTKDEAISDAIRAQWKQRTGKDFPIPDKE